jgi:hypothetical protein
VSLELERLARLETTLVGAAATQATRRRRRRRRSVVLAVVVAPLVLVAAGSVARVGTLRGVDHNLSVLRDDRVAAPPGAVDKLSGSLGARSSDGESERSWLVGRQRVEAYRTRSGRFCFGFSGTAGGCFTKTGLTSGRPLDPTADRVARGFRVYGVAADEVTSVTLAVRGVTHRVALSRNAFYLQVDSPVGPQRFTLTLLAHLRDGETTQMRIPVADSRTPTMTIHPALPDALSSVEDTAA